MFLSVTSSVLVFFFFYSYILTFLFSVFLLSFIFFSVFCSYSVAYFPVALFLLLLCFHSVLPHYAFILSLLTLTCVNKAPLPLIPGTCSFINSGGHLLYVGGVCPFTGQKTAQKRNTSLKTVI